MNKPEAHLNPVGLGSPTGPAWTTDARTRSLQLLTQLHATYSRQSIERLVHGLPWEIYQGLADEVEARIKDQLDRDAYGLWLDRALLREAEYFHLEGAGQDCDLCRQVAA
jgi:hypothetical protein